MNPFQRETDWFGMYPANGSKDEALFPAGREKPKRVKDGQRKLLGKGLRYAADVPDSTAHPAKMSLPLLGRILDTMQQFGWLHAGDCVVDPFGGRGSTAALWCARNPRNRAVTIEIEPHFVRMQETVRDHAGKRLGRPLFWEIIPGDSRKADALLTGGVGVTSPPYGYRSEPGRHHSAEREAELPPAARMGKSLTGGANTGYGRTPGQIGVLSDPGTVCVTSPPYGNGTIGKTNVEKMRALTKDPTSSLYGRNADGPWFQALAAGYVNSEGNIDNLPDAAVTSPPYERALGKVAETRDPEKAGADSARDILRARGLGSGYSAVTSPPYEQSIHHGNGIDPEKLTGNKAGRTSQAFHEGHQSPDASVLSPPYEAQSGGSGEASRRSQPDPGVADRCGYKADSNGTSTGQIGATQGETYSSAVLEVYSALARAGVRYLAVVTKNPTRDGKLRRLDKLTARLLRQSGYRVVAWRRAWLWEKESQLRERGAGQPSLMEELGQPGKAHGRLSFFKRIHLAKGSPCAQYEDVFFCVLAP